MTSLCGAWRRWKKRQELQDEQAALEFYAALADHRGRWGQRYADHVVQYGQLIDRPAPAPAASRVRQVGQQQ